MVEYKCTYQIRSRFLSLHLFTWLYANVLCPHHEALILRHIICSRYIIYTTMRQKRFYHITKHGHRSAELQCAPTPCIRPAMLLVTGTVRWRHCLLLPALVSSKFARTRWWQWCLTWMSRWRPPVNLLRFNVCILRVSADTWSLYDSQQPRLSVCQFVW